MSNYEQKTYFSKTSENVKLEVIVSSNVCVYQQLVQKDGIKQKLLAIFMRVPSRLTQPARGGADKSED
jgi:hypothetical protein